MSKCCQFKAVFWGGRMSRLVGTRTLLIVCSVIPVWNRVRGPKVQIYWGESSRTLFQRGKEHWAAYASKSEASVLHKHESEHHQNVPAEWRMKVYNYHSKPLRRQIEEGVLINNARGGEILNSKSEMTRGWKRPRLVIMVRDKEEKEGRIISLVATMSTLARTMCMYTHYIRTNNSSIWTHCVHYLSLFIDCRLGPKILVEFILFRINLVD